MCREENNYHCYNPLLAQKILVQYIPEGQRINLGKCNCLLALFIYLFLCIYTCLFSEADGWHWWIFSLCWQGWCAVLFLSHLSPQFSLPLWKRRELYCFGTTLELEREKVWLKYLILFAVLWKSCKLYGTISCAKTLVGRIAGLSVEICRSVYAKILCMGFSEILCYSASVFSVACLLGPAQSNVLQN